MSASRLESARRRLRLVRYLIVVTAAGAFAGTAVAVRAAHPAGNTTQSSSGQASVTSAAQSSADGVTPSSSDDSGSSLSPATTPPVIQSGGS